MRFHARLFLFRLSLLSLVCGPLSSGVLHALSDKTISHGSDEKPVTQRRPTDDEEKRVTELTRSIERLRRGGKFTEAIEPARQVVAILERAVGPDHWRSGDARRDVETLRAIARLPEDGRRAMALVVSQGEEASSLQKNNRFRESETIRRRLAEDLRRWLGEEHPETATNYGRLAVTLALQGRFAEAQPLMQKGLDIRLKVLGEGHPDTAKSYQDQALLLTPGPVCRRGAAVPEGPGHYPQGAG